MGASLSPLELLLPRGFARGALVLGGACPSVLTPPADQVSGEGQVDLVVVAPTEDECRDPAWVASAADAAVTRISPDGIVYLVPARAKRARRALVALGLEPAFTMLHVPDIARSRHVVPVGTAAERYALSGRLDLKGARRLAASIGLRVSPLAALGPTGTVFRRGRPAPLASWLFEVVPLPGGPGSVLLTTRRVWSGGTVVHRFPTGRSEPDAIAKVSPQAPDEQRGLREIAPAAGRAGAHVPEVLWSGRLGPAQALVQSALAGTSAARLLEGGRLDPGELSGRLAGLLESWSRETARPRQLGEGDLDRLVLSPARRLAAGNAAYVDYLAKLCARVAGSICPLVPTHGDLTATNVLVDRDGRLGILDWEEAAAEGLPLTDFLYSAADAVAATGGYRDRVQAFGSCFVPGGAHAATVEELRSGLGHALAIDDVVQEVCFHACWLHHASNEQARSTLSAPGPFVAIVQMIAEAPERLAVPRLRS